MGSTLSTADQISARLQGLVVWHVRHRPQVLGDEVVLTASDPLGRDRDGLGVRVTLRAQGDGRYVPGATSGGSVHSDSSVQLRTAPYVYGELSAAAPLASLSWTERDRSSQQAEEGLLGDGRVGAMWWAPKVAHAALAPLVPFRICHARMKDGRLNCTAAPLALPWPAAAALSRVHVPTRCDTDARTLEQLAASLSPSPGGGSKKRPGGLGSAHGFWTGEARDLVSAALWAGAGTALTVSLSPHAPDPLPPPPLAAADSDWLRWPIAGVAIPDAREQQRPVLYTVAACTYGGGPPWAVQRRYSAFWRLKQRVDASGDAVPAPFPPKTRWLPGARELGLVEARRRALETWLQAVIARCGSQSGATEALRVAVLCFVGGEVGAALPPKTFPVMLRPVRRLRVTDKVGVSYSHRGVVSAVQPGGPAACAGLEPGMRLLSVAGQAVATDSAVHAAFIAAGRDFVVLATEPPQQQQPQQADGAFSSMESRGQRGSILSGRRASRGSLGRQSPLGSRGEPGDPSVSGRSWTSSKRVSFREAAETVVTFEPSEDPTPVPGQQVTLQGLVALHDLNGQRAIVVAYNKERDKWHIRLDGSQEEVLVNLKNIVLPDEAVLGVSPRQQTSATLPAPQAESPCSPAPSLLELQVARSSPQDKVGISYTPDAVVTRVQAGGAAARAGLRPGMRLISVAGKAVGTSDDAAAAFLSAGTRFPVVVDAASEAGWQHPPEAVGEEEAATFGAPPAGAASPGAGPAVA
eukprot:TRINITY_DN1214_c2_g1_i1.p1 TRINITY_DN1214_c2_g1~~TRINITY_DN1214_c2_g1_i1.p1  ORF type:complete len:775 (+),score=169.35 TRINITY_DN1214_c2_g1_i1:76-2325(+)